MSDLRIFFSAGETSGDLHGAALAEALDRLCPGVEMLGLAGPRMEAAGVRPIVEFERLPVTGFVEVLPKLPFFLKLRREVRRLLREDRPDLVIPIDYPGFNLWLAREARRQGSAVMVYIAPQVWAWRSGRTRALARDADRVAVVFPQEEAFLRDRGVEAHFVGHPLVDRFDEWPEPEEARVRAGCDPDRPVLGLLPGSRTQEVIRHLDPFLATAAEVRRRRPDVQILLARAPEVSRDRYESAAACRQADDSRVVLRAATAVLTKAGTSTVEAALADTPMVVAHRVNPFTYWLARRLVRIDSIAMVNLLAERQLVPEFIQRLPESRIADTLLPLLDLQSAERRQMLAGLQEVRERLGGPGAAQRAAELARELVEGCP